MALGPIPSKIERVLAQLDAVVDHSGQETDGDYICAVLSAQDADARVAEWRDDPRHRSTPVLAISRTFDEERFLGALIAGADDVVLTADVGGVERRLTALQGRKGGEVPRRGSVLIVHPDASHRRRLGRPLFRSGLSLDFASNLEEVTESAPEVDVAVVHDSRADGATHNVVRQILGKPDLPVVVVTENDPTGAAGVRVERTASIPLSVPADHLLFVVNELLNPTLKELRASPRLLHSTLCGFRTAGQLIPRFGATFNISRGGVFVRTLDLPDMGESIWLEFVPPGDDAVVHLRATVAWRTTGGATPAGFATQLLAHRCPADDLARYREHYQRALDRTHSIPGRESQRPPSSQPAPATRLLIVDDDPKALRTMARLFKDTGIQVEVAHDGREAVELFRRDRHDVVLTDLNMPNLSGIDLLKAIRADDEEVPVLITTGDPALETAIEAMENGALRYILKPFEPTVVRDAVTDAIGMSQLARFRRQASMVVAASPQRTDEIGDLDETLSRAIQQLYPHFQPIVRWPAKEIVAYEALARTREPRVPHPGVLFDAAERLDRLREVGRRMRVVASEPFAETQERLFINLHPTDLMDEELYDPSSKLAQLGERVTLEITERASLSGVGDLRGRVNRLRELGFRVAVDDLGAGYAGLSAFCALQPDVVKLDMSLVRDVHLSETKRRLIRSMVSACEELNIQVISEGVETREELDALSELGCELFQGFLLARPGPAFPEVDWPS